MTEAVHDLFNWDTGLSNKWCVRVTWCVSYITRQGQILNKCLYIFLGTILLCKWIISKVLTTKPNISHPNFVFTIKNDVWVTRWLLKDAVCFNKQDKRIHIGRQLVQFYSLSVKGLEKRLRKNSKTRVILFFCIFLVYFLKSVVFV